MDQSYINWVMAGFGGLIMFVIRGLWDAVKDLQKSDKEIADKVSKIEILVAGQYITRDEFKKDLDMLFEKLEKISNKIDSKADK